MKVLLKCGSVVSVIHGHIGQVVTGLYRDENGNFRTKTGRVVEILEP